jgi:hypothetical protein
MFFICLYYYSAMSVMFHVFLYFFIFFLFFFFYFYFFSAHLEWNTNGVNQETKFEI